MSILSIIGVIGNKAAFAPVANHFVASAGFNKTTDFTGNANGKQGLCSFWIKPSATSGFSPFIGNGSGNIAIGVSGLAMHVYGANAAGSEILGLDTTTNLTLNVWTHILMSWDLGAAYAKLYINDVYRSSGFEMHTNDTLDYADGGWTIAESGFAGCLSEFYFAPNQFLDITNSVNRRKFVTADLKAVDLGADGSIPTGTSPLYYMRKNGSNRLVNSGSGGNFDSITGVVIDCTDAPD